MISSLRRLFRITIYSIAFLMAACASRQAMVENAQTFSQCKQACQQQLEICSRVCHNSCSKCSKNACQGTRKRYNRYQHEQCVRGEFVMRELQSYRDPLQCRKNTCDCQADYRVCVQSCAGKIRKRLQVVPACVPPINSQMYEEILHD